MEAEQGIWLGLLKWTLAHQDGTSPSPAKEMTAENKAFLEAVMRGEKTSVVPSFEHIKVNISGIRSQCVNTFKFLTRQRPRASLMCASCSVYCVGILFRMNEELHRTKY